VHPNVCVFRMNSSGGTTRLSFRPPKQTSTGVGTVVSRRSCTNGQVSSVHERLEAG
jgi:hypothetical protein